MKKYRSIGLVAFTTAASGLSFADCPNSMPEKLLEDCIVYEGAGSSFPPSDYAHMDNYKEWQKTQQSKLQQKSQPISPTLLRMMPTVY